MDARLQQHIKSVDDPLMRRFQLIDFSMLLLDLPYLYLLLSVLDHLLSQWWLFTRFHIYHLQRSQRVLRLYRLCGHWAQADVFL